MIQSELKQEYTENTLLRYIKKINVLPLDKFASIMPANTIIDVFVNVLHLCAFSALLVKLE